MIIVESLSTRPGANLIEKSGELEAEELALASNGTNPGEQGGYRWETPDQGNSTSKE